MSSNCESAERAMPPRSDMTAAALAAEQDALYRRIDEIGRGANPAVGCFHDGVAFPSEYLGTKRRIMWVLKNSYDETDEQGNPASDGMDIRDWFSDEALAVAAKKQIFVKMALVSHCVQNGLPYSADLLSQKASLISALKGIALVDLSKLPGGTKISDRDLKPEFALFKEVVSAQIALYAPDIIIFGNTLHLCFDLFPALDYKNPLRTYEADGDCVLRSFSDGARLCLEAYHPSYPMEYENYVGTIARAALGLA